MNAMNVGDTRLHSSCIHKTIVVQNIPYVQALCCVPLGYSVNNRTPLLMTKMYVGGLKYVNCPGGTRCLSWGCTSIYKSCPGGSGLRYTVVPVG